MLGAGESRDAVHTLSVRDDRPRLKPQASRGPLRHLIADKGFDNDALRQELDTRGATAVIPPKANRARQIACDFAMYRWRHLVENFFCDLKQFRRIATRYDKTDQSFSAMIYLAASFMALK